MPYSDIIMVVIWLKIEGRDGDLHFFVIYTGLQRGYLAFDKYNLIFIIMKLNRFLGMIYQSKKKKGYYTCSKTLWQFLRNVTMKAVKCHQVDIEAMLVFIA